MNRFKDYIFDFKALSELSEEESKAIISKIIASCDEAFELFESLYDTGYGTITKANDLISISTGGWSDNEALIEEFRKTHWWSKNFVAHKAGGHYFFKTDSDSDSEWKIVQHHESN